MFSGSYHRLYFSLDLLMIKVKGNDVTLFHEGLLVTCIKIVNQQFFTLSPIISYNLTIIFFNKF